MLTPREWAAGREATVRRAFRSATVIAGLALATALPMGVAAPARADLVRQRQQWVLNALDVPAAWRVTHGGGVLVAVVDSGVDPSVSDLAGSVQDGPDYTGVSTPPSNPNWGAHGTWMASLIAGHGHGPGGSNGIIGVAPRARILSVRVITDRADPGYHQYWTQPAWRAQRELARGIRYAVGRGAEVISMSLGYNESSLAVRSALQYALNHNVVVVASSGNAGSHSTRRNTIAPYSFPADYPGVIGVAAVTPSGKPAFFSSGNLSVSVAAPGVDIPAQGRGSKYWVVSGTSPACALTAGVAALIRARYPKLSAELVRSAITRSTVHRPRGGYDDQVGFGTVDAAAALRMAGRLARQVPGGSTPAAKAAAQGRFGPGKASSSAFPVAPRGRQTLLVWLGIALGCLLLVIIGFALLIGGWRKRRRERRLAAQARQATLSVQPMRPDPPGAGGVFTARPVAGGIPPGPFTIAIEAGAATAAGGAGDGDGPEPDVRYPTQIYPAEEPGQPLPVQGYLGQPGQGMPVQGYLARPAQAEPGQLGQAPPGQAPPGQAPPWQAPPGQVPPGQVPPGQVPPGQVPPGQVPPGQVPQQHPLPSRPDHGVPGAGNPGPAAGAAGAAAPTEAAGEDDGQDDWLFEDQPSQIDADPEAGLAADQQPPAAQQDDHHESPVVPPSTTPRPNTGAANAAEDPLTSPRFSRQNLPRDDGRWRAFSSEWLTRQQDARPGARLAESSAQPGQPPEPVVRSVWEPLVRSRPAAADDAAGPAAGRKDPQEPKPAAEPASRPEPPSWAGPQPRPEPPSGAGPQPRPEPPSAAEPVSRPEPPSGPEPLPRRQPMTHLAAPLRRAGRSQAGRVAPAARQGQHEAGEKLPSVWDTRRPAALVNRAAESEASESADESS